MALLAAAVALVGIVGLLNLLLVLAVVRRLREHGDQLAALHAAGPMTDLDPSVHVGRSLPEFAARTVDGRPIDSAALRGDRWLVGFFSVGCEPCHEQAPEFAARAAAGERVLAVVVGDAVGDDLPALLAGVDNVVVERSPDGTAARFGIRAFPTLLEYAPDGTVVGAAETVAGLDRRVPA